MILASHELITPLTSIKGYTQILEKCSTQINDAKIKLYLKKTSLYVKRLDTLVSDILDTTMIQEGKLKMADSEFSYGDMIHEAIETVQLTTPRHNIIVNQVSNCTVRGDQIRLEQVMINLLSNAIKYSPRADRVEVNVIANNDHIETQVKDYGIGIKRKYHKKIFDRFYRIGETAMQFSGLGVGLYISKEIINRHKGEIWLESSPGAGSAFYFRLPR